MTTEDIHLVRTDDEVQLLFEAKLDFQAKKAYGGGGGRLGKHKGQL